MTRNRLIRTAAVSSLFIATLAWMPSIAAADATLYGGIRGTVTDSESLPLTGVRVTVTGNSLPKPLSFLTGTDGAYSVSSLPVGEYLVTASHGGFGTAQSVFTVVAGKDGILDLWLSSSPPSATTARASRVEKRSTSERVGEPFESTGSQLTAFRSQVVDVPRGTAEAQVVHMRAMGYTITEEQQKYIVEGINREDLALNVARASDVNEIIVAPDVNAAVRAEYLRASRDLLDKGVSEEDLARVAPQVLSGYVADIASDSKQVAGLTSRLLEALKLGGGLFFAERNSYGRLKISLSPPVAEFLVRVDAYPPFLSPQKPLVIVEGPHKVSVDVATKVQCNGKVTIPQGELRTFPCTIHVETPK